jgi:hypothetical protein
MGLTSGEYGGRCLKEAASSFNRFLNPLRFMERGIVHDNDSSAFPSISRLPGHKRIFLCLLKIRSRQYKSKESALIHGR